MSGTVPTIAVIRETTLLTDDQVVAYAAAQQIQIDRDFAPIWGLHAVVEFVAPGCVIPAGAWQIVLIDHSPDADALGAHDDTGPGGLPRSWVAVADDMQDKLAWTVTASHECLEMLADPMINQTVDHGGYEFAMEVCDSPEDDRFAYAVDGQMLSAFVTPAWFGNGTGPLSHPDGILHAPFRLAPGGYIGRRQLPNGEWQQEFEQFRPGLRAVSKGPCSRTMRRFRA